MNTRKISLTIILAVFLLLSCENAVIDETGNLVPPTVDQDPSIPSITVNDAMLHAEAFGPADGSMVVCIHGGPGGDYRYMLNCRDLAEEGYRVVLYDQRGSGLSQRFSKNSFTDLGLGALDLLYDEISGVIAYYRTSPDQNVFLLGHSWGGILASGYTGRNPANVQGLVVWEPGGLEWDDIVDYVEESRSFNLWGEMLNDATYLDQFMTGNRNDHEILDYKMAMITTSNDITGDDGTEPNSFWRSGAVISAALLEVGEDYEPDFSEGIDNFNTPVLFFYSEKNKAYPDSWAQKISGEYNSAELYQVMEVGHDGMIKNNTAWTEQTLPRILTYLNQF